MAFGHRVQIQKSKSLLIFVNLGARDFTSYDFAENTTIMPGAICVAHFPSCPVIARITVTYYAVI